VRRGEGIRKVLLLQGLLANVFAEREAGSLGALRDDSVLGITEAQAVVFAGACG